MLQATHGFRYLWAEEEVEESCSFLKIVEAVNNSVGTDCGSWGWAGQRRAKGENWDNYHRTTNTV